MASAVAIERFDLKPDTTSLPHQQRMMNRALHSLSSASLLE
jgi:hypothetical protein